MSGRELKEWLSDVLTSDNENFEVVAFDDDYIPFRIDDIEINIEDKTIILTT